MCGFVGCKNLNQRVFQLHEPLLAAMNETIVHRGPNGGSIWLDREHEIGFGFRRLSIIDLSDAAMQPMSDAEKTAMICFNGEIYNYKELRKELTGLGCVFITESDTEVILHVYKIWGIEGIRKLDGMFAIALYDLQKRRLYLIRDRIGVKPLYFSLQGGCISFASEIKALWVLPWITRRICDVAIYHYLTFMVTPAPYTAFEGIYKLPAGFYICIDEHKRVSFTEWYSPVQPSVIKGKRDTITENTCLEKIKVTLSQAVEKRMGSHVPFGAFLSGGIDSSLNVALMSQWASPVKTFSLAFHDDREHELAWAHRIVNRYQTDHRDIVLGEAEAFQFYKKVLYHLDEPLADPVCIPFFALSQFARQQGVSMVHVGEGADELFFGYQTYLRYKNIHDHLWQRKNIVPQWCRRLIAKTISTFAPHHCTCNEVMYRWSHNKHLFWGGAIGFGQLYKRSVLQSKHECQHDGVVAQIYPGMQQIYDSAAIVDYHLGVLNERDPEADFCQQMLYLELKQRLPELLLMRVDKMSMATGLEAREPFLDYALVELMYAVPASLKVKQGTTKYLLKKVASDLLPRETIHRKKVGFAAPTMTWFNSGAYFKPYFDDVHIRLQKSDIDCLQECNFLSTGSLKNPLETVQRWVMQNLDML